MTIQTDDMELAGNIVQSIGKFLAIADLQTTGDFPQELEILQQVFSQVKILFYNNKIIGLIWYLD
jgi:Bardet-Biedl syndrome 2 protein